MILIIIINRNNIIKYILCTYKTTVIIFEMAFKRQREEGNEKEYQRFIESDDIIISSRSTGEIKRCKLSGNKDLIKTKEENLHVLICKYSEESSKDDYIKIGYSKNLYEAIYQLAYKEEDMIEIEILKIYLYPDCAKKYYKDSERIKLSKLDMFKIYDHKSSKKYRIRNKNAILIHFDNIFEYFDKKQERYNEKAKEDYYIMMDKISESRKPDTSVVETNPKKRTKMDVKIMGFTPNISNLINLTRDMKSKVKGIIEESTKMFKECKDLKEKCESMINISSINIEKIKSNTSNINDLKFKINALFRIVDKM